MKAKKCAKKSVLHVASLLDVVLLIQTYVMVRTGLEKSLKIVNLRDILEKSLNFPHKFLNIFESSLNKNNLR